METRSTGRTPLLRPVPSATAMWGIWPRCSQRTASPSKWAPVWIATGQITCPPTVRSATSRDKEQAERTDLRGDSSQPGASFSPGEWFLAHSGVRFPLFHLPMKLTRRHFLAWAGLGALGAVACEGFGIREGELNIQSPVSLPEGPGARQGQLVRQSLPELSIMRGHPRTGDGGTSQKGPGKSALSHQPGKEPRPLRSRSAGPVPSGPGSRCNEARRKPRLRTVRPHRLGTGGNGHPGPPLKRSRLPRSAHHQAQQGTPGASDLPVRQCCRGGTPELQSQSTTTCIEARCRTCSSKMSCLISTWSMPTSILSFGADFLSHFGFPPTRWNRGYGDFRQGEGRDHRGTLYHVDSRFSMTAANADKWIPHTAWVGRVSGDEHRPGHNRRGAAGSNRSMSTACWATVAGLCLTVSGPRMWLRERG